ncbi:hypothetical protein N9L68_02575 [bacterium]|nr:hypothetical protein [bacterium]
MRGTCGGPTPAPIPLRDVGGEATWRGATRWLLNVVLPLIPLVNQEFQLANAPSVVLPGSWQAVGIQPCHSMRHRAR